MEIENRQVDLEGEMEYWKKSWVAYLRLIIPTAIIFFISILVGGVIVKSIFGNSSPLLPISFLMTGIYFVLSLLTIKSYKLFYDEDGIWVYSGIFPWNKGISGIKWRDLDEAVYQTGFVSWAVHSYSIRLSHRYTKASEILLKDMAKGDKAVATINELHIEYLRKKENKK